MKLIRSPTVASGGQVWLCRGREGALSCADLLGARLGGPGRRSEVESWWWLIYRLQWARVTAVRNCGKDAGAAARNDGCIGMGCCGGWGRWIRGNARGSGPGKCVVSLSHEVLQRVIA